MRLRCLIGSHKGTIREYAPMAAKVALAAGFAEEVKDPPKEEAPKAVEPESKPPKAAVVEPKPVPAKEEPKAKAAPKPRKRG